MLREECTTWVEREAAYASRIANLEQQLADALREKQEVEDYCDREVARAYGSVGKTCRIYEEGLMLLLPEIESLIAFDPNEAQRVVDAVSARLAALEAQNAEKDAVIQALREALGEFANVDNWESRLDPSGGVNDEILWLGQEIPDVQASRALAATPSTALCEIQARVWDEAAEHINFTTGQYLATESLRRRAAALRTEGER